MIRFIFNKEHSSNKLDEIAQALSTILGKADTVEKSTGFGQGLKNMY